MVGLLAGKECFCKLNRISYSRKWTDKNVSVFISFDCDRSEDEKAFPQLLALLKRYELLASFAVVGALVEENVESYKTLINAGHEILNHGYSRHTSEEAVSTFFYNGKNTGFIKQEIEKAQRIFESALGICPLGFRVPHFGTFQSKELLMDLYRIIAECKLRYSSSAMVYPIYKYNWKWTQYPGVIEIPLSNRVVLPFSVFDSYSMLMQGRKKDFYGEFKAMVDSALSANEPTCINFYLDPSHVVDRSEFEACLQYLKKNESQIWTGCYKDIL